MILNDNTEWTPEDADIVKWQKLYAAVDVFQELNAMEGWLDANPKKRKTKLGIKRFVNSWLARAQDKGGSPQAAVKTGNATVIKTRDMSSLDDLSHNYTGCPNMREYYLQKYEQVFENGVRTVK